jgi:hypothetical protein
LFIAVWKGEPFPDTWTAAEDELVRTLSPLLVDGGLDQALPSRVNRQR